MSERDVLIATLTLRSRLFDSIVVLVALCLFAVDSLRLYNYANLSEQGASWKRNRGKRKYRKFAIAIARDELYYGEIKRLAND